MILNLVSIKDKRTGKITYYAVNNKHYDIMLDSGGCNFDLTHEWGWLGDVNISEQVLNEEGYWEYGG